MVLTQYQAALAQFLGADSQFSEDDEATVSTDAGQHHARTDSSSKTSSHGESIADSLLEMAGQGSNRLDAVEDMNLNFNSLLAAMTGVHTPTGTTAGGQGTTGSTHRRPQCQPHHLRPDTHHALHLWQRACLVPHEASQSQSA